MSNDPKPLSCRNLSIGFLVAFAGIPAAIIATLISAFILKDARFDPGRNQNPTTTLPSSPDITPKPSIPIGSTQPPSSTPTPIPTISGIWEGTYVCSLGVTGVTIDVSQSENTVIADFSLYPVPENPNIPRGLARYQGDFNSTSRRISFPKGTWINKPDSFWTAYPFHGQFDENFKNFSGEIDGYRCTTINLSKKDS